MVQRSQPPLDASPSSRSFFLAWLPDIRKVPRDWAVLGGIWMVGALVDGLWLWMDQAVPSWDLAKHLTGSLNFWWTLRSPTLGSGEWWQQLWMLSSKYPPFLYLVTAPLLMLFGPGPDQAVLVNLLFSAVLLISVYGLGRHLFNASVGLWAAGLCLLMPHLSIFQLQYLMDFPLTAMVTASFCSLTLWRGAKNRSLQWVWGVGFGVCFGLTLLTKQTALLFLLVPLLWVGMGSLWQRQWERLLQLLASFLITLAIFGPWARTNWIFMFSAGQDANVNAAMTEGDPPLNTLEAWTYYWHNLPSAISWPLLLVPLVGIILCWSGVPRFRDDRGGARSHQIRQSFQWLLVYLIGVYLLWSAIVNKDPRYVMPYLPAVAVLLGYGLTCWPRRWGVVRWGTIAVGALLLVLNLFPVGGAAGNAIAQSLSGQSQYRTSIGTEWPHRQVIEEITAATPYQLANIGMLSSTWDINEENFNYYGNLQDFQVYARRMGSRVEQVAQDLRSLSWFLRKAEPVDAAIDQPPPDARVETVRQLQQSPDFQLHKTWTLPDGTPLNLYRRRELPVEVQPLGAAIALDRVGLDRIVLPQQSPPGAPVPITYEWSGPWEQLHTGTVLLSWKLQATTSTQPGRAVWLHDHGIGLGTLRPGPIQAGHSTQSPAADLPDRILAARIIERTAMLPPADAVPGTYSVEVTYLNPQTGETYAIAAPSVTLTIAPNTAPTPAPEVDWVTQLRNLATALPQGPEGLEPIFEHLDRLNMYDPIQNFFVQAEATLDYRFQQEPQNLEYAYGLVLSRVLQRKVEGAIAALQRVIQLDAQNPYAYAYLGFVNLYNFQPRAAQSALQPALAMKPDSAEIQGLAAVAALMRGNLWQAWQYGKTALDLAN